ncbi:4910_t:CDS:2 [Acaulospora morrowiae]|uniref:4910_t:CDS:1 n=1 Tax=Acaulospora morrowiae TaxID=94023 RepID=A0A9N9G525_9GLOM|nr:4910_t:CDS:2 [Acaulospora morrowiae]
MSSVFDEIYVGHDELVSYLTTYTSFWGFISRFREVIVTSSLTSPTSCWQDLNNTWVSRFLYEARKIDESRFITIEDKFGNHSKPSVQVRSERLRCENSLQEYWEGVEQECKMRRDITNHKAEIELVLRNLSELNEQLRIKEADLSELTSKWYKSNISPNHSDMGDFVEGFKDDLGENSNGRSVDDDNNSSSNFGSNFAEGFDDDLGGNSDRGSVDENTSDTLSGVVGTQNSQQKINRKRRDVPLLSREFNLRTRRNINYNVGPLSKRRHSIAITFSTTSIITTITFSTITSSTITNIIITIITANFSTSFTDTST